MKHRLFLILGITLISTFARAQDSHYWYSEFSAGGFFMPGAVISNNGDSGVYFYNPALFGSAKKSFVSINANVYQYGSINIKNGAGTGRDLKSTLVNSVPAMLAGSVVFKKFKKPLTFAYALTRTPGLAYSASQRRDEKFQVLQDNYSPGTEYFVGQAVAQNGFVESTGQISFGIKLNEHWSAGITAIGDIKKQNFNLSYTARALGNPGGDTMLPIVASEIYYLVTYNHIGLKFRGGVTYDDGPNHLGLIITSPLIHIQGSATLVSDQLIVNMQLIDKVFFNVLASTRQTKLPTKVKTPLSIGLGYTRDLSKGKVYVAAEYFYQVGMYDIISPRKEGFLRPDTGGNNALTADLLRLSDARRPVLNFAAGYSFMLKPNLTGYISARTDFSYAKMDELENSSGFSPYICYWNNIHWQVGANLKRAKYNLRGGLLFCYGAMDNYPQLVNLDNPSEINALLGETGTVSASNFSVGFMISYIHNF